MEKILFVCTGNTCRSPMAEAIFNRHAPAGCFAYSAGISCSDGKAVSENSVIALSEICTPVNHTSVQITSALMREYDKIIGITSDHAKYLSYTYPEHAGKISAFPTDVSDPYGCDIDAYRRCRDMIYDGVMKIIGSIS